MNRPQISIERSDERTIASECDDNTPKIDENKSLLAEDAVTEQSTSRGRSLVFFLTCVSTAITYYTVEITSNSLRMRCAYSQIALILSKFVSYFPFDKHTNSEMYPKTDVLKLIHCKSNSGINLS